MGLTWGPLGGNMWLKLSIASKETSDTSGYGSGWRMRLTVDRHARRCPPLYCATRGQWSRGNGHGEASQGYAGYLAAEFAGELSNTNSGRINLANVLCR